MDSEFQQRTEDTWFSDNPEDDWIKEYVNKRKLDKHIIVQKAVAGGGILQAIYQIISLII